MPQDQINPSQLYGGLTAGLEVLDGGAQVTFQAYTRVVLPIDGYVFWSPTTQLVVAGSLHYSQEIRQSEDETFGSATVVLTAENQIAEFAGPGNTIYVASCAGFRYAFSQQQGFYQQAGLWHYFGHSVEPAMAAQLLDSPNSIDPTQAVVSNSLPLWLALNNYVCPYFDGYSNSIPLFPSMLTTPNLLPSYGAVHIGENDTRALSATPHLSRNRTHSQLCADKVRITLYGLQNNAAMDFIDCVNQYSLDHGTFGIMNMPVIRDAKRNQTELMAIAMKKVVEFEISYHQSRVNDVAAQLILSAVPEFIFDVKLNVITPLGTQMGQILETQMGEVIDSQTSADSASLGTQSGDPLNTQSNQDLGYQ